MPDDSALDKAYIYDFIAGQDGNGDGEIFDDPFTSVFHAATISIVADTKPSFTFVIILIQLAFFIACASFVFFIYY